MASRRRQRNFWAQGGEKQELRLLHGVWVRSLLFVWQPLAENIARVPDSPDRIPIPASIEGPAQAADIDVDRPPVYRRRFGPGGALKLIAGEHAAGICHQHGEQPELGGSDPDLANAARDPKIRGIEQNVAENEDRGARNLEGAIIPR